jgi:branched-chain amino acid transport system substrate-binding protein
MQESYRREPAASTHDCSRPRSTCPGAVAKAAAGLTAGAFIKARPSIRFHRRLPHAALTLILLPLIACRQDLSPTADGKVHFGVSAPLTGDNAQYARLWRQGFVLALEDVNNHGGVRGRKVVLDWEDSESDPKQAVNIAQRFVDDPRILAEMGDFSSPCSMAASPVYQRGGLVQFGFTNSHPDFTKSGDYMFSTSASQEVSARLLLDLAEHYGRRTAVLYVNNDWGKSSVDIYVAQAAKHGVAVPVVEGFADSTTDFRPLLLKVRDAAVDVLVIQSYYRSAALIVRQTHQVGLEHTKVVWGNYSQEFINLAGEAAEGTSAMQNFYAEDAGPQAQDFVRRFRDRYKTDPDYFNVGAYDALMQLAWAAGQAADPTRQSIRETLATARNIPSVIYGPFAFGADRRMSHQTFKELVATA